MVRTWVRAALLALAVSFAMRASAAPSPSVTLRQELDWYNLQRAGDPSSIIVVVDNATGVTLPLTVTGSFDPGAFALVGLFTSEGLTCAKTPSAYTCTGAIKDLAVINLTGVMDSRAYVWHAASQVTAVAGTTVLSDTDFFHAGYHAFFPVVTGPMRQ